MGQTLFSQFITGFLNLGTTDIWSQKILYCEACPVLCREFSNIPGLYPLDACSDNSKYPAIASCPLGGKITVPRD